MIEISCIYGSWSRLSCTTFAPNWFLFTETEFMLIFHWHHPICLIKLLTSLQLEFYVAYLGLYCYMPFGFSSYEILLFICGYSASSLLGDKRETRSTGSVRPVILQEFYWTTLCWCDFIVLIIIKKKVGDCFWQPSQQFAKALPSIGTCILSFPLELSVCLFSVQMSTRYIHWSSRTPSMLMHFTGVSVQLF